MTTKGTILGKCEAAKGGCNYRGHVVTGDYPNQLWLIYSMEEITGSKRDNKVRLLYPSRFAQEAPDEMKKVNDELMTNWPMARLPDHTLQAKEVGAIAFGLPMPRSSPYHQDIAA